MTRINTNVPSLVAQRVLGQNNNNLNTSLERLSTGLRINRGKDDPAGLIASQNLRQETSAISAAITNAERADQVVNIAEGGLNEVSSLLNELQGLITTSANDAGLSLEEREANQLQIDSILQTIDRIADSTSFQGSKLLNGNFDYQTSGVGSTIEKFRVNGAKLEFNGELDVEVIVTQSAQLGGFVLSFGTSSATADGIDLGADESFVIEIGGALGTRELSFASGTTTTQIRDTINSFTDVTGVEASLSGNGGIRLESTEFGSSEFVSVTVVDDGSISGANGIYNFEAGNYLAADTTSVTAFNASAATNGLQDEGQDVAATINGLVATAKGREIAVNSDFLDVSITLDDDTSNPSATQIGQISAFTITGGGAEFQLAGRVDIAGKVGIGIGNVAARELGETTVDEIDEDDPTTTNEVTYTLSDLSSGQGINVVNGNLDAAQNVVDNAIREVSSLRGRLGAFQANTIGATVRNLNVALEATSAAESVIRDTDFATETASLTRSQILSQSAQTTLQLANQQPQAALALLG